MLLRLTDLMPMPCPRPRVSRFGAYYPAGYRAWKRRADRVVRSALAGIPGHSPFSRPVAVGLMFVVPKPKKTKLATPRPDIDNYIKAIFDACNELVWIDDTLVVEVQAVKMWANAFEPGIYMTVELDEHRIDIPAARTVPAVRKQGRAG